MTIRTTQNTCDRRPPAVAALLACGALLAATVTLAGCGPQSSGANALTKDEKALMSAPPGQPMPEAARKAMAAAQAQGHAAPPPALPAAKATTP